jgi:phage terminase large subunit
MHDNPLYFEGGDPGPSYIRAMETAFAKSKLFFDRFILGRWTNAEGAIYDGWDPAVHVVAWDALPPMYRMLGVGMDFGTEHATSVVMLGLGYDRKLYLVDELRIDASQRTVRAAPSVQARMIADWLKLPHVPENTGLRPEYMFADPSAAPYRQELSQAGVDTSRADNDVSYGIGLVSSLLARGLLKVADRCAGVIEEAPGYVWDAKKSARGVEEPVKDKDDSLDAFRYVVASTEALWRDEIGPRDIKF